MLFIHTPIQYVYPIRRILLGLMTFDCRPATPLAPPIPPPALELRGIVISLNLNLYSLASYREFVAHMTKRNEHAPGGRWRKVGGRRPHPHPYPAPSISTTKFPLRTRMAAWTSDFDGPASSYNYDTAIAVFPIDLHI